MESRFIEGFNFAYIINIGSYKKLTNSIIYIESILSANNIKFRNVVSVIMDDPSLIEESKLKCELGVVLETQDLDLYKFKNIKFKYIDGFYGLIFEYRDKISLIDDYYKDILERITKSGYMMSGFPIEFYLKNPQESEQDGLCHINIIIPTLNERK